MNAPTPLGKTTVRDLAVRGKRVLLRADLNVPLAEGAVADDTRLVASLPTIRLLLDQGASIVLCSHLGRPKGAVDPALGLRPVAARLSELLEREVELAPAVTGDEVEARARALEPGQILLLENLRFDAGEKANDPAFAAGLAALADVYVNDAFGTAHRAHASTAGVAGLLPAAAGLLLERELAVLGGALADPARPFVAVLGGAKVSDKIQVVENLLSKVDTLLIGGGMANTFFAALGHEIGESLVEADRLEVARDLLQGGIERLQLPVDVVVADRFAADAEHRVVPVDEVPAGWRILDIGPETVELYRERILEAKTVVWNGPLGVTEFAPFAQGTNQIAQALADAKDATTIVGGGDSAAALERAGLAGQISHLSTGGGASLQMLAGKELPAVAALTDA